MLDRSGAIKSQPFIRMGTYPLGIKTFATSSGLPFSVSLRIAAPPEASSFHYDLVAGACSTPSSSIAGHKDSKDLQLKIIAAHDDSVLIESRVSCRWSRDMFEYFLYEAGAGRTPSLSLLPGCYVSMQFE